MIRELFTAYNRDQRKGALDVDARHAHPDRCQFAARPFNNVTMPTEVLTTRSQIHWIDTPGALRSLCQELPDYEVLALDVETAPDFVTLCLLQVATPGHTYLIDPFAVADLSPLAAVFGAEQPVKVIHNASFEKKVLKVRGLELCGVFDTMVESKRIRPEALDGYTLAKVCERELGAFLDKSQQTTSDWSRRPLDSEPLL